MADVIDINGKSLPPDAQKRIEERERARVDKMFLANEVLGYTFQPDVHGELFANFIQIQPGIQLFFQSDTKDRLVLWSRGHYKSTAATVEVIQLILNWPDVRVCIMRSTKEATEEWMNEILAHFTGEAEGSRLGELFPEFCGTKKALKATGSHFTVPARTRKQLREATVTVASATSNTTGKHFDVGMFDDLVTPQNCDNKKQLDKVTKGFYHYVPLIEPGGYKYVTGTRYAHGDLYEQIIHKNTNGNWVVSVKTCWSDDGQGVRFPQRVVKTNTGVEKVIGFTRELLLQIRQDDPAMFASQYLNPPASTAKQVFSDERLLEATIAAKDAPSLSQAMLFIDTASSIGEDCDDTVVIAAKQDVLGRVYIVDAVGGRWLPGQQCNQIIAMSQKYRPLRVMFEKTAGIDSLVALLNLICRDLDVLLPIDYIKVDNQEGAKNTRVLSLDDHLRKKKLFFFAGLAGWDKIVSQLKKFPKGRGGHDDWADCVALAVRYLTTNTPVTTPLSAERHPLLRMIEMHGRDVTDEVMHGVVPTLGNMGSDFACD